MCVLHSKGLFSLKGTTVKSDGQPSIQDPWVSVPVFLSCPRMCQAAPHAFQYQTLCYLSLQGKQTLSEILTVEQ